MSDVAIAQPAASPQRSADKPKQPAIGNAVRRAIEAMVWEGLPRREAAQAAGIREHSLYKALRRPPVLALYRSECEVLRESERARTIHRFVEIRDAADNMPAVNAGKELIGGFNDQRSGQPGVSASAGVTIKLVTIVQQAPAEQRHSEPESRTLEITKG